MDIQPFFIGQEIVAIVDHLQGVFKKGDEFKVISTKRSTCKCKKPLINIGIAAHTYIYCCKCLEVHSDEGIWYFDASSFAPKHKFGEFVSMKEVIQLETVSAN